MTDAVVVGSGHNGLVAACHLAVAGLSVEVVEADEVLGGAVSTVERWPGVRVDRGSSAHVIIRHSGIVEELDLAAMVRILVEPKNALTKQFRKLFELDGVDLEFSPDAIEAVADLALLRGTGARGLRAILEEVLLNVMYDVPSREDVAQVVITGEVERSVHARAVGARAEQVLGDLAASVA